MKAIDEKLKGILKIIHIANKAFYISRYLHEPDGEKENEIIDNSEFLRFSRYAYLYMAIIELNKIIDDNESHKHNLYKLLNTMENNLKSFNKKISKEDILDWREKLNSIDKDVLKKIKNLRDKLYAHLDLNKSDFIDKNSLLLNEIGDTLEVTKQLIKLIYDKLNGVDLRIDNLAENTISERHVKRIRDLRAKEIEQLIAEMNSKKN